MPDIKKQSLIRSARDLTIRNVRKSPAQSLLVIAPTARTMDDTDKKLMEQIFAGLAWHG